MVYIIPIISRSATGKVIPEHGAGGGAGDLIQSHDLELEDEDSKAQSAMHQEDIRSGSATEDAGYHISGNPV